MGGLALGYRWATPTPLTAARLRRRRCSGLVQAVGSVRRHPIHQDFREKCCVCSPPSLQLLTLLRGGAVWQLVGLITRRSQVQILPPLPDFLNKKASS